MEKLLDGASIEYAPGRVMECHAIVDSAEGWKPVNLREYFDEQIAETAAIELSRIATRQVLAQRNAIIDNALPLPEFESFPASRIFDFVNGLGMEPIGRLAYVKKIPGFTLRGLTDYQSQTALVDQSNIVVDRPDQEELSARSKLLYEVFNAMSVHGVAVHELTHLAGAQDVAY